MAPPQGLKLYIIVIYREMLKHHLQERLQGSSPNLAQMFLMGSRPSVFTFYVDPKSKMATLASDWLRHFQLLLKNGCMNLCQKLAQMFVMGSRPSVVTFYVDPKSKMATLASDLLIHFQLL